MHRFVAVPLDDRANGMEKMRTECEYLIVWIPSYSILYYLC